jgi:serine/threonine-protein kinase ATR
MLLFNYKWVPKGRFYDSFANLNRPQAERAFQSIERRLEPNHSSKIDLGTVLKSSIVGILSLMNRGLNESTAHRPLRYKQQIIRSLEFVTERVGPAIAGYSPQVCSFVRNAPRAR